MRMRLRQVVLVAADLAAAEQEITHRLGVELCHRDPGVAAFGVRNALFPVGDQFLEVISPMRDGTTAGRQLAKRGGDSGYMVMLEVDDLDTMRRRVEELDVRIVHEGVAPGIVGVHLHPADIGGAILSVDRADVWGAWPWAGPSWRDHVRTGVVDGVEGVRIAANDPSAMAGRWGKLLDCDVIDRTITFPDGGEVQFVPAGGGSEGVVGFRLRASRAGRAGAVTICNCSFELVAG